MPRITLIYFGSVLDTTGIPSEIIDSPATLNELNASLVARFPWLAQATYRFSVNRKLAEGDHQLADGDEIALLPPFAGG